MYDPDQGFPIPKRGMAPLGKTTARLVQSPQQLTLTSNASAARLELAGTYTKLLLGCYRVGDANDPEVYTAAILAVFSKFPEEIMREVVDPLNGLPAKIQWLPTVKEVRDACEKIKNRRDPIAEWDERAAAQLAERKRLEEVKLLSGPRETWEQTKADLAQRGYKFSEQPKPVESAELVMQRYGITAEQWAAIPDLPEDFEVKAKR